MGFLFFRPTLDNQWAISRQRWETEVELCSVLQDCDSAAKTISVDSGSDYDWSPVVIPMKGYLNSPTARIHLPRELNGDVDRYTAEIHKKEFSGATTTQKLISSNPSVEELESLVNSGTVLDAFLSLEPYDYQQRAGIRLVARKLVIHSKPYRNSTTESHRVEKSEFSVP